MKLKHAIPALITSAALLIAPAASAETTNPVGETSTVASEIEDATMALLDNYLADNAGKPLLLTTGDTTVYVAPNGAYKSTQPYSTGTLTTICRPPKKGNVTCYMKSPASPKWQKSTTPVDIVTINGKTGIDATYATLINSVYWAFKSSDDAEYTTDAHSLRAWGTVPDNRTGDPVSVEMTVKDKPSFTVDMSMEGGGKSESVNYMTLKVVKPQKMKYPKNAESYGFDSSGSGSVFG